MTEWIVTSSVLIAAVAALRCLLRGRISLRLQYALWAVVLLRLLLPVQLGHSSLSVLNAVETSTLSQYTEIGITQIPQLIAPQPSAPTPAPDTVTQPDLPPDGAHLRQAAGLRLAAGGNTLSLRALPPQPVCNGGRAAG